MTLSDLLASGATDDALFEGFAAVGSGAGPDPLPRAGGGAAVGLPRRERRPGHPHWQRQEPGGRRRPPRGPEPQRADLLHRPDQGPGEREVLRPHRGLRRRQGRHDDRRRGRQRASPDHLLHRRDPGQPHPARGRRHRRRCRGDGRVPLLRRARPRLGLAGAAAGAAEGAVPADVGDPRRRHPLRARADRAHRPRHHRRGRRRAPGPAVLLLRHHPPARDAGGAAQHPRRTGLRRALHPAGRGRAGAGADERQRLHPRGEGPDRRADRRLPLHQGLRADAVAPGPARHRRAPRRDAARSTAASSSCSRRPGCSRSCAAPTPSASASTSRSAPCCSPA